MSQVNVTIAGRKYRMACEDGQESHLTALAEDFDRRLAELHARLGEIGDARLVVVTALTLADELFEAQKRIAALEADLVAARERDAGAVVRAQATQGAVIAALNAASERIEQVTRGLNQGLPVEPLPFG
jgi:cell division protein ZapA